MKKMFNEGNQTHNFMSSSGSGTVINYGSGSDFLTSYGSGSTTLGAGSIPHLGGKILNLSGPRSENRQWGDICPNASGDEWNSLLSATLR